MWSLMMSSPPPQAMLFLRRESFDDVSFKPLSHVHTGNVYLVGEEGKEECRVGGYENTLLGYKTRLYKPIHLNHLLLDIDVIMFGEWGVVRWVWLFGEWVSGSSGLCPDPALPSLSPFLVQNIFEKS